MSFGSHCWGYYPHILPCGQVSVTHLGNMEYTMKFTGAWSSNELQSQWLDFRLGYQYSNAIKWPPGWNSLAIILVHTSSQGKDTNSGIILASGSANERHRYIVTAPLIGWAHSQNDPWKWYIMIWTACHHWSINSLRAHVACFDKVVNLSLAKLPLNFNGGLAKLGLTSLVK